MKPWVTFLFFALFSFQLVSAQILINEFTADPQQDWDRSGFISASDKWIEIYNNALTPVDLTNWTIGYNSTSFVNAALSGTILPESYLILPAPSGTLNSDGQIRLYDSFNNIIDSVIYGTFNDGNLLDNAPTGSATSLSNECLARFPNAYDTGVDSNDFVKQFCTFNITNSPPTIEIANQSLVSCVFKTNNVTLSADISYFGMSLDSVLFETNINGVLKNFTAVKGQKDKFSVKLTPSDLSGGTNLFWTVFVNDSLGNIYNSSWQAFYVRDRTQINLLPSVPNGENLWYIAKPFITLTKDAQSTQTHYRWNNDALSDYISMFTIKDTDNKTGGLVSLTWFSEFPFCGNEEEQRQTFKLDFTDPAILELFPANNSISFDARPKISALISDIYQSNSGINSSSIKMYLDNTKVSAVIEDLNSLNTKLSFTPNSDLTLGAHNLRIMAKDYAGRLADSSWNFEVQEIPTFFISVFEPSQYLYLSKRIPFNFTVSENAVKIEYKDFNDAKPTFKSLCRNCKEYGFSREKTKSLNDGPHNITIKATDFFGDETEKNVFFIIDSTYPSISKTLPKKGFTNGRFSIEFREENTLSLVITYGNDSLQKAMQINISDSCVLERTKYICEIALRLSEFNNQTISYFFTLEDVANNSLESEGVFIDVDSVPPVINNPENLIFQDGRQISFRIDVTEANFDKVVYIDYNDRMPREVSLCSSLNDGICAKRKTFKSGGHNIDIIVKDKAGNFAQSQNISFTV